MNIFERLFRSTLPQNQLRDSDGRFLPHRVTVRKKAIELATEMGRDDLVARLQG